MGCYLAPDDASTLEEVVAVIIKRPREGTLLMFEDFNTNLAAPKGQELNRGIAATL